jgi:hypothetical protein
MRRWPCHQTWLAINASIVLQHPPTVGPPIGQIGSTASGVRDLVQLDCNETISSIGVIANHVILDLVVVREAKLAERTLKSGVVHASDYRPYEPPTDRVL